MEQSERRQAGPRVVKHFLVRYRGPNRSRWDTSPLQNFSRNGARLVCEQAFAPGTELDVQVGMPLFASPVRIAARVAWQRPAFKGRLQLAEHGISFALLDQEVRETIGAAIQQYLKEGA